MSTSVVSVRVNEDERGLLEAAADNAKTNLSDFVRRKAVEAAEEDLMDRKIVVIPPEAWEQFEAQMREPPKRIDAAAELLELARSWED